MSQKPEPKDEPEEVPLEKRFPIVPHLGDIPMAPKVTAQLPPDPSKVQVEGSVKPGEYTNLGLSMTAAGTFVSPIIVLSLIGYFLDMKFKTTPILVFIGLVIGFIVGVTSLMRVSAKLSK
ncbi:MAG: AtpZ/AtpI family protein [Chthonomonadaceae bacterium]|nr:AtpZ/AtpI family protein [Chthonomonadaceae bacterium]